MAVSIPEGATRQPNDELSMEDGAVTASFAWKGPFAGLETAAANIAPGDAMPTTDPGTAWKVVSWDLRRVNANYGVLTVRCKNTDATTSDGTTTTTTPFRTVYSVKSVRNDVSILAYCGDSPDSPNRPAVERWMREPDPKLASEFKYKDGDGSVVDIANDGDLSCSVPLIRKIKKGIERVIRFYPHLTIKRQFYAPPPNDFQKLAHIDTPPAPTAGDSKTLAPNGISSLISDYEWLKVQDDCDEQQDRTWMRVESWIGILKTTSPDGIPWDRNLYGESTDRWQMPAYQPEEYELEEEEAAS